MKGGHSRALEVIFEKNHQKCVVMSDAATVAQW